MQWLHASWGIGVTIGPMIMTTGIKFFNSWRWGYVLVGAVQLTLAACFALTSSLWQRRDGPIESETSQRLTDYKTPFLETLRQPPVWLSILFFFLYTGIEATLGSWAYTLLTESRGILPQVAGLWTGSYWATFTMGRVLAGLYAKRIGVHTLIRISLLAAFGGAMLLWWNPTAWIGLSGSGHHRFFYCAHLSRLGFRHQRARRAALCGKYDWHADWRSRLGNGDSSGYRRRFGPTDFPGNDSGVPDRLGDDAVRVVFIVYVAGENTFDLKLWTHLPILKARLPPSGTKVSFSVPLPGKRNSLARCWSPKAWRACPSGGTPPIKSFNETYPDKCLPSHSAWCRP